MKQKKTFYLTKRIYELKYRDFSFVIKKEGGGKPCGQIESWAHKPV